MMKNILISNIKKSTELLGKNPNEKQIKRLEVMSYEKLVQQAEYARQAIMLQVQNELIEANRSLILGEKLKWKEEEGGTLN